MWILDEYTIPDNNYNVYVPILGSTFGFSGNNWIQSMENSFEHAVKAAMDVHFHLSPCAACTEGVEVVIGGWSGTQSAFKWEVVKNNLQMISSYKISCLGMG